MIPSYSLGLLLKSKPKAHLAKQARAFLDTQAGVFDPSVDLSHHVPRSFIKQKAYTFTWEPPLYDVSRRGK